MKKLILFLMVLLPMMAQAQTQHFIRQDTIRHIPKTNVMRMYNGASSYNFETNQGLFNFNKGVQTSAGILIGNSTTNTAGNIRWDGSNFQGYDGATWNNFDETSISGNNNEVLLSDGAGGTKTNTTFTYDGTDLTLGNGNIVATTTYLNVSSGAGGNDGINFPQNASAFIAINGTSILQIDAAFMSNSGNWYLRNIAATSTVPNIIPDSDDQNSGIGWAGSDQISIIAGGIETARISTTDVTINRGIETPFETEAFSATKTIDFDDRNFKVMPVTGATTINVSNLPEGVSTLVMDQDATGYAITIGTGWGNAADNTGTLSTTANAKNIVQFVNDGTDVTYFIVTQGN